MEKIWELVSGKGSDPTLIRYRKGRNAFWMDQKIKERLLAEIKALYRNAWEDAYHNLQKDDANFLHEAESLIELILKKRSDQN